MFFKVIDFLKKDTLISRSILGGIIVSSGDLLAQTIIEGTSMQNFNYKRYFRSFFMGGCIITPWLYNWYGKILPNVINISLFNAINPKRKVLLSTIIDQTVNASFCAFLYLTIINYIESYDLSHSLNVFRSNYIDVMIANYYVWPVPMYLIFKYVNVNYRTIFVNFIAVIWNLYLSFKNNKIKINN